MEHFLWTCCHLKQVVVSNLNLTGCYYNNDREIIHITPHTTNMVQLLELLDDIKRTHLSTVLRHRRVKTHSLKGHRWLMLQLCWLTSKSTWDSCTIHKAPQRFPLQMLQNRNMWLYLSYPFQSLGKKKKYLITFHLWYFFNPPRLCYSSPSPSDSDDFNEPTPSFVSHFLHPSLPRLNNLLIFQCVCSSLCNSATVCQYANEVAAYGSFLI